MFNEGLYLEQNFIYFKSLAAQTPRLNYILLCDLGAVNRC